MRYLITLENLDPGPLMSAEQVMKCLEEKYIPTMEACARLEADKVIIAGGALDGTKQAAIIIEAPTNDDLARFLQTLPLCGVMHMNIAPLETFEDRATHDRQFLDMFKAALK